MTYANIIEDKIIQSEYKQYLESQMTDWLDEEDDNLFKVN
jgi:hypothetical protein